VCADNMNHSKF